MTIKAFRFPVSVRWRGGRLTRVSVAGKPSLEVATPPEFRGGIAGVWSPEDLLVASAAACFTVTLVAVAERMDVPLLELGVTGTGHIGKRDDGRFGFVAIELDIDLETTPERVELAERAAEAAEERCLVSMALEIPVHVAVDAHGPSERLVSLSEGRTS